MSGLAILLIGMMVGAAIGVVITGILAGAKISDLYDKLDEANMRGPLS